MSTLLRRCFMVYGGSIGIGGLTGAIRETYNYCEMFNCSRGSDMHHVTLSFYEGFFEGSCVTAILPLTGPIFLYSKYIKSRSDTSKQDDH